MSIDDRTLDRDLDRAEWQCTKCHEFFVDPDDLPSTKDVPGPFEQRLYWLSESEPLCFKCAATAGIPPVDEG